MPGLCKRTLSHCFGEFAAAAANNIRLIFAETQFPAKLTEPRVRPQDGCAQSAAQPPVLQNAPIIRAWSEERIYTLTESFVDSL